MCVCVCVCVCVYDEQLVAIKKHKEEEKKRALEAGILDMLFSLCECTCV